MEGARSRTSYSSLLIKICQFSLLKQFLSCVSGTAQVDGHSQVQGPSFFGSNGDWCSGRRIWKMTFMCVHICMYVYHCVYTYVFIVYILCIEVL